VCPSHSRTSRPRQQDPRPRGRLRRCLLKGCEQLFLPSHPQARYCSTACRTAARRWRNWQANQRYRATDNGKAKRRDQNRRKRQRRRERAQAEEQPPPADAAEPREGQRPESPNADFSQKPCDRPGCRTLFVLTHDLSKQRFCCSLCRKALRCVLDREARYRQRRRARLAQGQRTFDTS
jgi:hypothetical protein